MNELADIMIQYNEEFYSGIDNVSQSTSSQIVPILVDLVQPASVLDVGCGSGAWIKSFQQYGIKDIVGVDGSWAAKFHEKGEGYVFVSANLTKPLLLNRTFDLLVCIEVAEHLPEEYAFEFIKSLAGLSNIIAFSAAIPGQGGVNHINEQWQDYWVKLFVSQGYEHYDCLRMMIWNNEYVDPCVAQNILLFVKEECQNIDKKIIDRVRISAANIPISIIHPRLFVNRIKFITHDLNTLSQIITIKMIIKLIPRIIYRTFIYRFKKFIL